MQFLIFYIIIINLNIIINNYDDVEEVKINEHQISELNNINVLSISYEFSIDINPNLKVKIYMSNILSNSISFKAFLMSDDNLDIFSLICFNEQINIISCYINNNITLDIHKKYYFHFNQKKSFSSLYFDGKKKFDDKNRISLIFHPEIISGQILYKNNKKFYAEIKDNMISNGFLYITKKSKQILKKPKNGFNKYIELNNFIFRGGLSSFTLNAYKEAIRRGYKMVDADIIFTKDKIPVVSHGRNLKSISNGKGELIDKTLKELEKLDFGSIINKKYAGETILKFEDLLKLCRENNIIIDLDLSHLNYNEFLKNKKEYANLIIELIENYDMIDSIVFNEKRQSIIETFKSIRNDLSFSLSGMNEIENIKRIKDKYQDSKILIYNMGELKNGKKINKESVRYGLSLGKKIKAAQIDNINFANKVMEWGVNFICTNKLESFLIKNEKEEPIIVNCTNSQINKKLVICEINNNTSLIDNERYNIYYSKNIYNPIQDIVEEPIGEFKYINSNSNNILYYDINYFDFDKGIIEFKISEIINRKIKGLVGPSYENVANCYILDFICDINYNYKLKCKINKKDPNKIIYLGNYSIYCLEEYSFNPFQINNKINSTRNRNLKINSILFCKILIEITIIFINIFYKIKIRINNNKFLKSQI